MGGPNLFDVEDGPDGAHRVRQVGRAREDHGSGDRRDCEHSGGATSPGRLTRLHRQDIGPTQQAPMTGPMLKAEQQMELQV